MKITSLLWLHGCACEVSRQLIGVPPALLSHYQGRQTFKCLSVDQVISIDQVNDDFCDCPDGSDEPGTHACPGTSFFCRQGEAQSIFIDGWAVNDGICDCCDGSDEWMGLVTCNNTCAALAQKQKKEAEEEERIRKGGLKKKQQLHKEAAKKRSQLQDELANLERGFMALEKEHNQKQALLADAELHESTRVVEGEGKFAHVNSRIKELQQVIGYLYRQKTLISDRRYDAERILDALKSEYNPNFNDEGVKAAIRSYETYQTSNAQAEEEFSDADIREIQAEEIAAVEDGDSTLQTSRILDILAYLPPPVKERVVGFLNKIRTWAEVHGIIAKASTSGDSVFLTTAREAAEEARNKYTHSKDRMQAITEDLSGDYGPHDIFRALQGQCVKYDTAEYAYEVCFLSEVAQISRRDGSRTSLGSFDRGLATQVYENGARCWNGPLRRASVRLVCGEEARLQWVKEVEKCSYDLLASHPVACQESAAVVRDEL